MTDFDEVTQNGIAVLTARAPEGSSVTGYHEPDNSGAWTWSVVSPAPNELDETAMQGVSRQYVPTDDAPAPDTDYLELMATEMLSCLALPTAPTEETT